MDRLIRGYNKDRDTTTLLNTYDFIVLPVLNVDGYNYSWEKDRMWRKTRSLDPNNNNKRCVGADVSNGVLVHACTDLPLWVFRSD